MAHVSAGGETGLGVGYCRHRPEDTLLYQIIERYYPLFGAVKIIASIEDSLVIAKILEHLRRREAAGCADHAPRAPPSRPLTRPIE